LNRADTFELLLYRAEKDECCSVVIGCWHHAGVNVNSADYYGRTPLHTDSIGYDPGFESFETLVKYGADVTAKDAEGGTALHFLAGCFWTEKIDLLVSSGADIEAINYKGCTSQHFSVVWQHAHLDSPRTAREQKIIDDVTSEHIQLYIDWYHPPLNIQDNTGRMALDCALGLSLDRIVAALIERGALASGTGMYSDSDLWELSLQSSDVNLGWEYAQDALARRQGASELNTVA
jgi:ankyrin repeat protein